MFSICTVFCTLGGVRNMVKINRELTFAWDWLYVNVSEWPKTVLIYLNDQARMSQTFTKQTTKPNFLMDCGTPCREKCITTYYKNEFLLQHNLKSCYLRKMVKYYKF